MKSRPGKSVSNSENNTDSACVTLLQGRRALKRVNRFSLLGGLSFGIHLGLAQ